MDVELAMDLGMEMEMERRLEEYLKAILLTVQETAAKVEKLEKEWSLLQKQQKLSDKNVQKSLRSKEQLRNSQELGSTKQTE